MTNSIEKVRAVFAAQKREDGFVHPHHASTELTQDPEIAGKISREICRHPTEDFWYEGAREALEAIYLNTKDTTTIWTRGWVQHVATSGLGALRRQLPREEQRRLRVAAATDKASLLPGLLQGAYENNAGALIVIDDNIDMLRRAADTLSGDTRLPKCFVWRVSSISPQIQWNSDSPLFSIEYVTPQSVMAIKRFVIGEGGRAEWVIDWNGTLIQNSAHERSLISSIATIAQNGHT